MAAKKKRPSSLAVTGLIDKRPPKKHPPGCVCVVCEKERLAPFGGAWKVGDDEDGFCALGPKRKTKAEAARDFPPTSYDALISKIVHRDRNPRNNAIENLIADPPYASGRGLDVLLGAVRHPRSPDGYELVTIELSPQCFAAVREMHRSGLFGLTERAVLEELVRKGVRLAIAEGWASRGCLAPTPAKRKR
jgi:hypothetical protein